MNNTDKAIIEMLKKQEEMLNQIHMGFTRLCLQLGVLAESLNDEGSAEDEDSELPLPELIQDSIPTMKQN